MQVGLDVAKQVSVCRAFGLFNNRIYSQLKPSMILFLRQAGGLLIELRSLVNGDLKIDA